MEIDQVYLSWVHEYAFCPRRFYLRVCEGQNAMNTDMIEGLISHQNVNEEKIVKRGNYIQVFSMKVFSKKYNLFGICDRVDFTIDDIDGYDIDFLNAKCLINPIEFKHGRKRSAFDYYQQVCAQALCLEEMFSAVIKEGTIWFTGTKQSENVSLTEELRASTVATISNINKQIESNKLVPATYRKLCNRCAMYNVCDPKNDMANRYLLSLKKRLLEDGK